MQNKAEPCITCIQTNLEDQLQTWVAGSVQKLLDDGVRPQDILIVTATKTAAMSLVTQHPAFEPLVRTFHELALSILSYGSVAQKLGRKPRVLLPQEEKVLLEDMKVSGLKVGRLREMLKFFFKGISESQNEDPAWLINNEERSLYAFLIDHLKECEAILPYERGNLACAALKSNDVREVFAKPYVFVCGYTSLDMCGQKAVASLATRELFALGYPSDAGVLSISFPHADGLQELVHAGARLMVLDAAPTNAGGVAKRLARACTEHEPMERSKTKESWLAKNAAAMQEQAPQHIAIYTTPQKEFEGTARAVAQVLKTCEPRPSILIAVPNRAYMQGIVGALNALDIKSSINLQLPFVKGDPRKNDANAQNRFLTLLGLLANPEDTMLWRSWLGYGDWLLRSDAWEILRRIAGEQKVSMLEAIGLVRKLMDPASGIEPGPEAAGVLKFAASLREIDGYLFECAGLSGEALVKIISHLTEWQPTSQVLALLSSTDGSAAAMYETVCKSIIDPALRCGDITVAAYDDCRDMCATHLFITGMVDGYLPVYAACDDNETHDKRRKYQQEERKRLLRLVTCASRDIYISAFAETDIEVAERSKVDIGRVFMRKHERLATAKPSSFMWECEEGFDCVTPSHS
ncbi:MAG: hypothetical protein IKE43_10825 [Coriobacteriales bacterium]|nr:hypothetical protein [Coriobacteriales bacterium]